MTAICASGTGGCVTPAICGRAVDSPVCTVLDCPWPAGDCRRNPVTASTVAASAVDHPDHYGGKDNPYEAIKVIEAWDLNFNLGNSVKYISRHDKKGAALIDLKKARWYLDREIEKLEAQNGRLR